MIDRFDIVNDLCLRVDASHPAVVAYREQRYADAAALALRASRTEDELAPDFGMFYVVARARAAATDPINLGVAELFARWKRRVDDGHPFRGLMIGMALTYISQVAFDEFVLAIAAGNDDVTSTVHALAAQASPGVRRDALASLARHPLRDIREHFCALLGKQHRLLPPGSIKQDYALDIYLAVLAIGLNDTDSKVRERAVAAAYGLGLVPFLREHVLALLNDPDIAVRQYAIIALGLFDDDMSRNKLGSLLRVGSVEEVTSAIWAAARRRDLIEDVLAMAGDAREWVNNELPGAFAEVSVPLTDEQIAALERRTNSAEFTQLRDRHIERTRRGQPELGPDNRIHVVLKR
jgi:hypothetical protein